MRKFLIESTTGYEIFIVGVDVRPGESPVDALIREEGAGDDWELVGEVIPVT